MSNSRIGLGLTIVELLVVLALLGSGLGGLVYVSVIRAHATATAQELVRYVTHTRWLAVGGGAPRTLLFSDIHRGIAEIDGVFTCDTEGLLDWQRWVAPRGTRVRWPAMGLAFAPDGGPRRCDGSAVGNTTILIEGPRGDRAAVIVASLGRVRWERR